MLPRRRPQFTQENVEQQLQQIHLLDPSSSSENLEQLGPIIKQIHQNKQQEAYLRTIQSIINAKDAEIERICSENYQDFLSSVSTLFTVKSYTNNLRDSINALDTSVSKAGRGLVEKKRTLLQAKKTVANLDEAIDNLQAGLRVLDVVDRVGEMIKEGKYWSALRSLDDIQSMPSSSLSQTPIYQHIIGSLPSLREQIKGSVTAANKQWLLEIRNLTPQVGRLALDAMDHRTKRWKARRERDSLLRLSRVGSAVETVNFEKTGYNVLENEELHMDFKPLYQSIHIYTALDSLDELRRWYQESRAGQSELILQTSLQLSALHTIVEEITGFFIIEAHVLDTTGAFRSAREVEELWDALVKRLTTAVEEALAKETDPGSYLRVKEQLMAFVITVESYSYSTQPLHSLVLRLFEKYAMLLERQYSKRFQDIVYHDDLQPVLAESIEQRDDVLKAVWLPQAEHDSLLSKPPPVYFPWSNSFYLCCEDIRSFVQRFYQFIEGVSQHHRDVDELLSRSLDAILKNYVAMNFLHRLARTTQASQVAQMVTNLEHFAGACSEIERSLTALRSTHRGGMVHISAREAFDDALSQARSRIATVISSKLDDIFGLAEYDWTPAQKEDMPSRYLTELVAWLSTIVDSLTISEEYKNEAYRGAVVYIAQCLMDFLTDRTIPTINDNALSNMLLDIDFLEDTFAAMGHEHLNSNFSELRSTINIALSDKTTEFLLPAVRQMAYKDVKPKRLQALLEKLAKYGASLRDPVSRERADKRRREAEQVGRLFPGESR